MKISKRHSSAVEFEASPNVVYVKMFNYNEGGAIASVSTAVLTRGQLEAMREGIDREVRKQEEALQDTLPPWQ